MLDQIFNLENLLDNGGGENLCHGQSDINPVAIHIMLSDLFLYRQFYLDALRMRFCPNEAGIHKPNLTQPLEFLKANC